MELGLSYTKPLIWHHIQNEWTLHIEALNIEPRSWVAQDNHDVFSMDPSQYKDAILLVKQLSLLS